MAQLVTGWVDVAGTHCSGGGVAGDNGEGVLTHGGPCCPQGQCGIPQEKKHLTLWAWSEVSGSWYREDEVGL